jgi:hypothetical protein
MAGSHKFHDQYSIQDVKRIIVSYGTAADHSMVAAVTGKKIRLLSFHATLNGTAPAIRFESAAGGTALSGVMLPATGTQINLPFHPLGHLETAAGEALSLEVGGTTPSVMGVASYVLVDADGRE